jgi:hypothetical protein
MNKAYTRFSPLRSQFPAGFTPQELTVFSIEAAKAIIGEPEQSGRIVLLVMRRNESRSNLFNLSFRHVWLGPSRRAHYRLFDSLGNSLLFRSPYPARVVDKHPHLHRFRADCPEAYLCIAIS